MVCAQRQGLAASVDDLCFTLPQLHDTVVFLGQLDVELHMHPLGPRKDNLLAAGWR